VYGPGKASFGLKRQSYEQLVYYQFDGLIDQADVDHGVFTRAGGVSRAPFDSLNLSRSVGDDAEAVRENNRRMLSAFDKMPGDAVTAWLTHGRSVAVATSNERGGYHAGVDALITRERGLVLTMRFADCVPIVFYDPIQRAIGLAHAGWRGVAAGIVAGTIDALRASFGTEPHDVWVGIGPCIGVDRYRVGPEVIDAVSAACPPNVPLVRYQADGSARLDLNVAVASQLCACGVTHIEDAHMCTAANTDEWFSHRAENGKTGRFGVVIGLCA
jgi:YfiH family protein